MERHENAAGWGFIIASKLIAAGTVLAASGCFKTHLEKSQGGKPVPPLLAWFDSISGLGVLNWVGGVLIVLGAVAFVGTFVPVVGAIFPKRMSLACVGAGIASILAYRFLEQYTWLINICIIIGVALAVLTYWPTIKVTLLSSWHGIKAAAVKATELIARKDLNKDGTIG